jgi:beta-glucosidase
MTKKIIIFLSLLSLGVGASVSVPGNPYIPGATIIDTVTVPIKLLNYAGKTILGLPAYYGRIDYTYYVGQYDSLVISLAINPVSTGAAVAIDSITDDPTASTGNLGTKTVANGIIHSVANGINGPNKIWFLCHGGTPGAYYTATVTIVANFSGIETQTNSWISQMTNAQKDAQLVARDAANPRMGADVTVNGTLIPGWYASNGGSGVGRGAAGTATTFPSPCALGCTFDTQANSAVGMCIAREYWAKTKFVIEGPVMNMVRHPRGGRNYETFSEDPYLMGKLAAAWTRGGQSTQATVMPKHFVCNDWEANRNTVDINPISQRTLQEIYCMPFEYSVREGKAWAIMTAYNHVNGVWCTDSYHNMTEILKYWWGFRGYTFSDWQAIHATVSAARAGQDVELPQATYFGAALTGAIGNGANQVPQARFDDMARNMIRTKVFAGVIGGPTTRYTADLKSQWHRDTCLSVARRSIVLVKNTNNTLPIAKTALVAVVGNYTAFRATGGGSGEMNPYVDGNTVSPLQGIQGKWGANVVAANLANVVIACYGVNGETEGADRGSLTLDNPDVTLLTTAHAAGKKTVVVLTGGSAAIDGTWQTNADAIIVAWYPGEMQGAALADILAGDVNPSGKLSSSWPVAAADIPAFINNQAIIGYEGPDTGRGYRYSDKNNITPLFAFGFGLSYTTFAYSNLRITPNPAYVGEPVTVTVRVTNTGTVAGDQVAQLYVHENNSPVPRTVKDLRGFARTGILQPGAFKDVSFVLRERELAYFDVATNRFVAPADHYTVMVGPSSRASDLTLTGDLNLQSPY